ncbi:MAG TPA: LptE family protein [Syntrophorhabdaceae bacterium]|nr:LptE family protein [Syntrophorhabdaceae bacterium]
MRIRTLAIRCLLRQSIVMAVLLFVLASCGYQLVREKGIYNGELKSIQVSIFKNQSFEPHISQYVTDAFSKELLTTGLFTFNKEGSDGYLTGTITSVSFPIYSLHISGIVQEKTVNMNVDLALYKRSGEFVKRWGVWDSEPYRVDNPNYEEFNKQDAIKRVSARMARRFISLLFVEY